MTFDVSAAAYGRFMGRFSEPLSEQFTARSDVRAGQRVLDVGCGPGALTAVLIRQAGAAEVSAIDPSPSFVAAMHQRFPEVDVRSAVAEDIPYANDTFDRTLAQLVVHFMTDPVAGLREMARVTRPGGLVAACVWDLAGSESPLSVFWQATHDLDPGAQDESQRAGTREGHLVELFESAGLTAIEPSKLTVSVPFASFDEWWEPYTLGVGPAGAYVAGLDDARRKALRDRCAELLPDGPFDITASAWCVVART